jgi:hypothetical protein
LEKEAEVGNEGRQYGERMSTSGESKEEGRKEYRKEVEHKKKK